jgi:PAS domain S-box-containing protein
MKTISTAVIGKFDKFFELYEANNEFKYIYVQLATRGLLLKIFQAKLKLCFYESTTSSFSCQLNKWRYTFSFQLENDLILVTIISKAAANSFKLIEDNKELGLFFQQTPCMYFLLNKEGVILAVNQYALNYLGYNEDELIDQPIATIIYEIDKLYNNEQFNNIQNYSNGVGQWPIRKISSSGNIIWVKQNTSSILLNNKEEVYLLVSEDETKEKEALILLQKQQTELMLFVASSPIRMAMLDRDCNYLAASELWCRANNLDFDFIIGKNHYSLIKNMKNEWIEANNNCLEFGTIIKNDGEEYTKLDGSKGILKWEIKPWYTIENTIGGIILFTDDITDRKQFETNLKAAKENAETTLRMKRRFISTMSHEIRTPLNGIVGLSNLLLMDNSNQKIESELTSLKYAAENLQALINDILDYSKIEAEKVELECISFNLYELIKEIIFINELKIRNKKVRIKFHLDHEIPLILMGDPHRLGQVFNNLISNALKFTPEGYVDININLTKIEEEAVVLKVEVNDTGIGIPENKLSSIFEVFTQADSDTTRKYGGTGLGLSISQKIIELMGSKIVVKSKVNEFTAFSFFIKLKKVIVSNENSSNATIIQNQILTFKNKSVLVVEDDSLNQLVISKFLEKWHIKCDIAKNGFEGISMHKSNEYDLILMDIQMPELDGYGATRVIRNLKPERKKNIPIIALTAGVISEEKTQMIKVGMNDYLTKPFKPIELNQILQKYLLSN